MSVEEAIEAYTALSFHLDSKTLSAMKEAFTTEKSNLEDTLRYIILSVTGDSGSKMVERRGSPRCKVYVS